MFINDKHHRFYELFHPAKPYKGEPPTLAGFLIYPDTPVKMETTSRKAFCFRPVPPQDGGKGRAAQNHQQRSHWAPAVPSGGAEGRGGSSGDRGEDGAEQQKPPQQPGPASAAADRDAPPMLSQYQKDFPPPPCLRRRSPALPHPDNIGINPAFRLEFSTVQREAFPAWSTQDHRTSTASSEQTWTKD